MVGVYILILESSLCFSSTWTFTSLPSHLDTSPRIHQQVDHGSIAEGGGTSGGGRRGDVLVPPWDSKVNREVAARNPEAKQGTTNNGHSGKSRTFHTPNSKNILWFHG